MGFLHGMGETFFRGGRERRQEQRRIESETWERVRKIVNELGFSPYSNIGPFGRANAWSGKDPQGYGTIRKRIYAAGGTCMLGCFTMTDDFLVLWVSAGDDYGYFKFAGKGACAPYRFQVGHGRTFGPL